MGGLNLFIVWDIVIGSGVVVVVFDIGYCLYVDFNVNILLGYDMIFNLFVVNDGGGCDSDVCDLGDVISVNECGYIYSV